MNQANPLSFPKRKVIQHSGSLFVCLPAIWCKQNSLKKHDIVSFEWDTSDNSLRIIKGEI